MGTPDNSIVAPIPPHFSHPTLCPDLSFLYIIVSYFVLLVVFLLLYSLLCLGLFVLFLVCVLFLIPTLSSRALPLFAVSFAPAISRFGIFALLFFGLLSLFCSFNGLCNLILLWFWSALFLSLVIYPLCFTVSFSSVSLIVSSFSRPLFCYPIISPFQIRTFSPSTLLGPFSLSRFPLCLSCPLSSDAAQDRSFVPFA